MYWTYLESPVGKLTLSSDGASLTGLWLESHRRLPVFPHAAFHPELPLFIRTAAWLQRYFAGDPLPMDLPLNPPGTPFRQLVWKQLLQVPYGETVTYGQLSDALKNLGIPSSPQAVGGAVGHNPISILIPCHRVIGADGSLTGYAGGLPAKQFLLRLEASQLFK